jgi:acyl transferase domain-containing protein
MLAGLYGSEPLFREQVDTLLESLDASLGRDLRAILTGSSDVNADDTMYAQPALFIAEYALARLWMEWGIVPDAVIGHSVGEFTAACIAGVFSPVDALKLVAARGKLMQELPRGKMLAVPLREEQVRAVMGQDLSVAAINGAELSIVSGPADAVDRLEKELRRRGVECRVLRTSHAFHSAAMGPIIAPFTDVVAQVPRNAPRMPLISNVTGTWLDAAAAADASYWGRHVRETVRFADGLHTLLQDEGRILIEVGPGQALTALAGRHPSRTPDHLVIASGRHEQDPQPDIRALLAALGRLWIAGVPVNWRGFSKHERRRRVNLPTYRFERRRHWIDPVSDPDTIFAAAPAVKPRDIADWFYVPSWTRRPPLPRRSNGEATSWLVFADECGCAEAVAGRLAEGGHTVTIVTAGKRFARAGDGRYRLSPADASGYVALFEELLREGRFPDAVAHFWGVTEESVVFDRAQERGFHSLLHLSRALGDHRVAKPLPLSVVTTNLFDVGGDDIIHPEKATVLGPCKVIPQERSQLRFRVVDLGSPAAPIDMLYDELSSEIEDTVVAHRGKHRWVQTFQPWPLGRPEAATLLRPGGCYLITGGRGRIGSLIAEHLAKTIHANLVLVGRSPATKESKQWVESLGVEVLTITADAADGEAMRKAVEQARGRFGRIEGVVHAAGLTDARGFRPFEETGAELADEHFRAKAASLLTLESLLRDDPPSRWLLISSLSSILGGLGMAAYAGANAFLDAFATSRGREGGPTWLSVDWDGWDFTGESTRAISPAAGLDVIERLLAARGPAQVAVSVGDLHARLEEWIALRSIRETPAHDAPQTRAEYAASDTPPADRNGVEQRIAAIWQELLGVPRVQPHDNFFELGGHSLLAIQLISRLRDTFHVEVSVHLIFEKPTVVALAQQIESQRNDEEAAHLERMVALVEGLSDEEVNALLNSQGEA